MRGLHEHKNPTAPRCYSCGIVGYKSPECPCCNKPAEPEKDKEAVSKKKEKQPKRQVMVSVDESDRENTTMATLYGQQLSVLLDTGAQMTVVPEELIPPVAHTGKKVTLRSFVGSTREVGTACVSFVFGDIEWKGEVVTVNGEQLDGRALLAVNVKDEVAWKIMMDYAEKERSNKIGMVESRRQVKERVEEEREEMEAVEKKEAASRELSLEFGESEKKSKENVVQDSMQEDLGDSEQSVSAMDNFVDQSEEQSKLVVVDHSKDAGESDELANLPCILRNGEREEFARNTSVDPTLKICRDLAEKDKGGYYWKDGLLMQSVVDESHGDVEVIVVPKFRRQNILKIAHDRLGHLGHKKVLKIVRRNFTWPRLASEVKAYCDSCQRGNKAGPRKAPMVECPVISVPFEQVALDIVGPLPVGKGGARFILTAACMATRWPEAVPYQQRQ